MLNSRFTIMRFIFVIGVALLHKRTSVKGTLREGFADDLSRDVLANTRYNRQLRSADETRDDETVGETVGETVRDMNSEKVELETELKRELIHAVVNMIQDDIKDQESTEEKEKDDKDQTQKEVLKKKEEKEEQTEVVMDKVSNEDVEEEGTHKRDHGTKKSISSSFRSLWKRKQDKKDFETKEVSANMARRDQARSEVNDNMAAKRGELRGPPGLWGRDIQEESEQGPPGLWGDTTAEERKKFIEAFSRFQKDNDDDESSKGKRLSN